MAFARYEKHQLIGKSHCGEVWQCLDFQNRRQVAALFLNPEIAQVTSWDDAWINILRYFRDFRHEYVVQAIDTDRDQHLILLELMAGSTRALLAKQESLQADRVRKCLRRCLEALADLHPAGLIHGDIRPDQLLFNSEGRFRLSFSVGLRPGGVVLHRSNFNQYLAPELLNPAAGPVSAQVDLYALGVTAYELLVGTQRLSTLVPGVGVGAFEPQKHWLKWQADLGAELPKLSEIFKNVPPDLAAVIDGLVRKKTADRFATARDALAKLNQDSGGDEVLILAGELPAAGPQVATGPAAIQKSGSQAESFLEGGAPLPGGVQAAYAAVPAAEPVKSSKPPVRSLSPEPTVASRTKQKTGKQGKKTPAWLQFLLLLLFVGVGYGGFFWWSNRNPAASPSVPAAAPFELTGTITPPDAALTIEGKPVVVEGGRWKWTPPPAAPAPEPPGPPKKPGDSNDEHDHRMFRLSAALAGYEDFFDVADEHDTKPIAITLKKLPAIKLSGTIRPGTAKLTINDEPVEIDGGLWIWSSMTPVTASIKAAADGHREWSKTIDQLGLQQVSINLEKNPSLIFSGTVTPPDARLHINGEAVKVENGQWKWESEEPVSAVFTAAKDGYEDWHRVVTDVGVQTIPIELKQRPAIELSGAIEPADSRLTVNGAPVELKDGRWSWRSVESVPVVLHARREGYEDVQQTWDPASGKEINIVLEKSPAIVAEGTLSPADAVLFINGEIVPTEGGRWSWKSLEGGEVTLKATKEGFADWEKVIAEKGKLTVPIELQALPAYALSGTVTPRDAAVTINGKPVKAVRGRWKWTSTKDEAVTIAATREGYLPWEQAVEGPGERQVDIVLERMPMLRISGTVDPVDAVVAVGGTAVEVTDGRWSQEVAMPGSVSVTAEHPNFAGFERTFKLESDREVRIMLDPLVSVQPPTAKVVIANLTVRLESGKFRIPLLPDKEVTALVTLGEDTQEFTFTRARLAELNYTLELAPTPPPSPSKKPKAGKAAPLKMEFDREQALEAQLAWSRELDVTPIKRNTLGMDLVVIPPGQFTIGLAESETLRGNALVAQPAVVARPFQMATTEVTQKQWTELMKTTPWQTQGVAQGEDYPAVAMTWQEAVEFCRRLTESERAVGEAPEWRYRLPTEAEWEWACRAGSQQRFTCPEDEIAQYAWYDMTVGRDGNLHPVERLTANRFGLFDVHGNAAEWCLDEFLPADSVEAPNADRAILRGGSWNRTLRNITSAARDSLPRTSRSVGTGFRVVRVKSVTEAP